jgi:hypothetical protein
VTTGRRLFRFLATPLLLRRSRRAWLGYEFSTGIQSTSIFVCVCVYIYNLIVTYACLQYDGCGYSSLTTNQHQPNEHAANIYNLTLTYACNLIVTYSSLTTNQHQPSATSQTNMPLIDSTRRGGKSGALFYMESDTPRGRFHIYIVF